MQKSLRIILSAVLCGLGLLAAGAAPAETYKIGVLAKRGPEKALSQWGPTAEYLAGKIPGATFEIVALGFDEVDPAVSGGKVDFFLVNSSMYVTTQVKFGASPVATMVNSRQGQPLKSFGGVILTGADNDDINSLADLKGRSFMAVEESSFGGWQMAYKELLDAGIDPQRDFSSLEFGGKHDNVVYAVLNGEVDAGTVRTDTVERMAAEGVIDAADLKVLNAKKIGDFPFVVSTVLYPEWPLAKTKNTADDIAEKVAQALIQMDSASAAAKASKVVGWTAPLDYEPVRALQEKLKVGAYE